MARWPLGQGAWLLGRLARSVVGWSSGAAASSLTGWPSRGAGVPGRPWAACGPAARSPRQRCLRADHAPAGEVGMPVAEGGNGAGLHPRPDPAGRRRAGRGRQVGLGPVGRGVRRPGGGGHRGPRAWVPQAGLARRIWTPVDLEAANPNVVAGDINSGSFAVDQQPLFRPDWTGGAGASRERACTWPAPRCRRAPVHGACGDLAARQALADQHRPARRAAAASSAWPWPPSKPPGNAAKDEPPGGMHAGNGSRVDEPPRRRPSAFSWS
jgi:hypothetical protein